MFSRVFVCPPGGRIGGGFPACITGHMTSIGGGFCLLRGADPRPPELGKRAVRILLKCFLVASLLVQFE